MVVLLALHAVLGLAGLAWGARLGRRGLLIGVLGPLAAGVWLLIQLPDVLDGEPVTESIEWVPALGLDLDLRLDAFAALMVALVAGIGVAVYAYALSYFPPQRAGLGRLVALLTLFAGSMLGLGPGRQPARALRLLGADDDHVVPADRQQPHRWTCSCGSTPGAA